MGAKKNIHIIESGKNPEISIIGISSHENDYRLSWALNNMQEFKLIKSSDFQSFNKRLGVNQEFSAYSTEPDEFKPTIRLISNRCEDGFLLEDLKNIDYLLLIENHNEPIELESFILKLKTVSLISAVFPLKFATLKFGNRLK